MFCDPLYLRVKILYVSQYFPPEMRPQLALRTGRPLVCGRSRSLGPNRISQLTSELKVARDHDQLRRILLAAFGSNDFDGFELNVAVLPGEMGAVELLDAPASRRSSHSFHWNKPGRANSLNNSFAWTIALDLLSSSNRHRGTLTVYRLYSTRDLQLDFNLLTAAFPTALADPLDRTLTHSAEVIPLPEQETSLVSAQAG
jgi:hypothetical protein